MRKLILSIVFLSLFASSAFAGTSFTVKVSFTIPERIEVNKCATHKEATQTVQCNDAIKVITQEKIMAVNNTLCLVRTVLPR